MKLNPKADIILVDYWDRKLFPHGRCNIGIKEAVENTVKFYPDLRFILVTDYAKDDKANPVKDFKNIEFIHISNLGHYPELNIGYHGLGHGIGLDEGVKHVKSRYFFVTDWHTIFKKRGWLEKIAGDLTDKVAASGVEMNVNAYRGLKKGDFRDVSHIATFCSAYMTEPVKKFNLSFIQSYFSLGPLALGTGKLLCLHLTTLNYKCKGYSAEELHNFL